MIGQDYWLLNICTPIPTPQLQALRARLTSRYTALKRSAELDVSEQSGTQKSETTTKGTSETQGGSSSSRGTNDSRASQEGSSTNTSRQYKLVDRGLLNELQMLDELSLPRLDEAEALGMYQVTSWLGARDRASLLCLKGACRGLFQRDPQRAKVRPLKFYHFDQPGELRWAQGYLAGLQTPQAQHKSTDIERDLMSMKGTASRLELATLLTARELNMIGGLPHQEVAGLSFKEGVSFGLNGRRAEAGSLHLGDVQDRGHTLKSPCELSVSALNRHTFIAGVTGAGKTTTCKRLLCEASLPFLVIEPTKTEYRDPGLAQGRELIIFTVSDEQGAPLRLNPFALMEGESICQRVDQLKASFEAAYDMEAAIPQLLEAALYRCYEWYGWDLSTNKNIYCETPHQVGGLFYPTLTDLSRAVEEVVEAQGFDARLQRDYVGSLKARLSGLSVGPKGLMMNTRGSVDLEALLEMHVVLELDALKAPSDKALLMGVFLGKWASALQRRWRKQPDARHLTLLEEAHRLLTRLPEGISTSRAQAVEVFTDLIAEVRRYGEGMIIADQIPSKLAPEVLKNTTTKIIHTLYARDDREVIGDTMGLDDEQRRWLAHLDKGEAVVISEGWPKSLCVKVPAREHEDFDERALQGVFAATRKRFQAAYYPEVELAGVGVVDTVRYQTLLSRVKGLWPKLMPLIRRSDALKVSLKEEMSAWGEATSLSKDESRLIAAHLMLHNPNWSNVGVGSQSSLTKANYKTQLSTLEELLRCVGDLKSLTELFERSSVALRALYKIFKP